MGATRFPRAYTVSQWQAENHGESFKRAAPIPARDGRRSLWADSVCNQEDKKEQNHQVKIMAMIYKGAESVLIWLGKETPKTRPAREFIESVSGSYGYSALKQPIDKHWWMTPPTLKSNIKGADKILKNARDCSIQDWYGRESCK
jgi:hypothetical protein